MKVKAEFFATLREKVGTASTEVSFSGNTVMDLIVALDEMFGGILKELMVEGGELRELVKILVNGKDVRGIKGLYTELKGGDSVSFFPPVAGG
jgi:molybdopterin synthase sulfur carrier subunit